MNANHQRFCQKLAQRTGLTKHDCFHAYDQWKRDGLIDLILANDKNAIIKAKNKYEWHGKQRAIKLEKNKLNPFEKRMYNLAIVSNAVSEIGSLEDTKEALDTLIEGLKS